MSSVPIQIDGVLWDHANKSGRKVTLMGHAHIMGLSVGGGPIMPPDSTTPPPGGGGGPDVPPHPEHPISGPPGSNFPDKPGYPPVVGGGPILPPEPPEVPTNPPDNDGFLKPPPPDGGWAYHQQYGWLYAPKPGSPTPKKG